MEQLYVVIVAAGSSTRIGGPTPKQFLSLKGKSLIDWSITTFASMESVAGIVVVAPEDFLGEMEKLKKDNEKKIIAITAGGQTRQESVFNGIRKLPPEAEWVAIHDAVRPFVTTQLIEATFTLAKQVGGAIPAVAIHDTLIQVDDSGMLIRPVSRDAVRRSQTPQIFNAEVLAEAHEKAEKDDLLFTDDATLVAYYGHSVASFVHYGENRKITTPQDMEKITMQKSAQVSSIRIGQGYDAHPFAEGRPLILAGVKFGTEKGLEGHSDGDVISHAICDSLLGAAALGDIGQYFPSSDPAYKNAEGKVFLEEVAELVRNKGWDITFIDATLIGEQPRITSRRELMREYIANALTIDADCVSIKASTTDKLGFEGKEEGLAAVAIATLSQAKEESPA